MTPMFWLRYLTKSASSKWISGESAIEFHLFPHGGIWEVEWLTRVSPLLTRGKGLCIPFAVVRHQDGGDHPPAPTPCVHSHTHTTRRLCYLPCIAKTLLQNHVQNATPGSHRESITVYLRESKYLHLFGW